MDDAARCAAAPHSTLTSMAQSTFDLPKNELLSKLHSLLDDTAIKSRTIVSMKQEMESLLFDKNVQFEQAREEINSLQQEVVQIHSEKEQISNVYQQEN
jgi:signal recognition particle GTPase